jgi:transcriptional regulator with XRE-family HTH domain
VTGDRETLTAIGLRIWTARNAAGLTLKTFAGETGVSVAAARSWEGGNRDAGIGGLLRMAEVLGVSPAWLLVGDGAEAAAPS